MQNNYIPLNPGSINGGSKPKKKLIIALIAVAVLGLLIWLGVNAGKKLIAETPDERRQSMLDAAQSYFADYCLQSENEPTHDLNDDYVKSVSIKDADKVNDYIKNGGTIPDSDDMFECASGLCNVDAEFMGADYKHGCPLDMYCQPSDIASDNTLTYSLLNQSDNSPFTKCPDPRIDLNNPKGDTPSGSGGDKPGGVGKYVKDIIYRDSSSGSCQTSGADDYIRQKKYVAPNKAKGYLCYSTTNKSTEAVTGLDFQNSCDNAVKDKDGKDKDFTGSSDLDHLCMTHGGSADPYTSVGLTDEISDSSGKPHWKCGDAFKSKDNHPVMHGGDILMTGYKVKEGDGVYRDRGLIVCATGGTVKSGNTKNISSYNTTPTHWNMGTDGKGGGGGYYKGEDIMVKAGTDKTSGYNLNITNIVNGKKNRIADAVLKTHSCKYNAHLTPDNKDYVYWTTDWKRCDSKYHKTSADYNKFFSKLTNGLYGKSKSCVGTHNYNYGVGCAKFRGLVYK